jgi:hypothetical protein
MCLPALDIRNVEDMDMREEGKRVLPIMHAQSPRGGALPWVGLRSNVDCGPEVDFPGMDLAGVDAAAGRGQRHGHGGGVSF